MDVVGAVVTHGLEIHSFQYLQGLNTYGSLAPGSAGVDIDPFIGAVGRGVDAYVEIGQVFHRQKAAALLMEFDYLLGNLALVEEIPGCLDCDFPAQRSVLLLNFDQALEAAGQVLLDQGLAFFEGPSTGVEDLGGGRPHHLVIGFVSHAVAGRFGEIRCQSGGHGEAVLRQLHGRGDHLLEGHGAVEFQGGHPSVGARGGDGAGDTGGQVAAELGQVVVDVGGFGPAAQTANLNRFFLMGVMDDDGGHAAKVGPLGQHHVQGDTGGHTGVGGVATLRQDPVTRRGRQVMPSRNHVSRP